MKNSFAFPFRTLAAAVAASLALANAPSFAQSTTGSIFGQVPAAAGESVQIRSSTGISRTVPVDSRGRYVAPELPLGVYAVSLLKDGNVIDSRDNVNLRANADVNRPSVCHKIARQPAQ